MADTSATQASPPPATPPDTDTVTTSASPSAAPPAESETEEAPQLETDDEAYVSSFLSVSYATSQSLMSVSTGNRGGASIDERLYDVAHVRIPSSGYHGSPCVARTTLLRSLQVWWTIQLSTDVATMRTVRDVSVVSLGLFSPTLT